MNINRSLNRKKWIINKATLVGFISYLLFFPAGAIVWNYSGVNQCIRVLRVAIFFAFFLKYYRHINRCAYCIAYAVICPLIITIIDRYQGCSNNILQAFERTVFLIFIFLSMSVYARNGRLTEYLKGIYTATLIYALIDLVIIIFLPHGIFQGSLGQFIYFSGGKFNVFYNILLFCFLYLINNYKKISHSIVTLLMLAAIIEMAYIECATGVMSFCFMALYLLFIRFRNSGKFSFGQKVVFILGIVAFLRISFLIITGEYQNNSLFIYIITNVLHRTTHLTGREYIYQSFIQIVNGRWLWGYGYGNTRVFNYMNRPDSGMNNMQNGVLDCIVNYGIFGLILTIIIFATAIYEIWKSDDSNLKQINLCVFLSFLIASLVEIAFNSSMFLVLAVMLNISTGYNNINK